MPWSEWLTASWSSALLIPLSALLIYVSLILMTRLMGLRSFSKMSGFDFAVTVAIGSVVASVILSPTPPLLQGIIGLASLFALQWSVAFVRARSSWLSRVTDNQPVLLMDGSRMLHENLRRTNVTEADLLAKLREANVIRMDQVKAVVFESTGDVSVLHSDDPDMQIDASILEGVAGDESVR